MVMISSHLTHLWSLEHPTFLETNIGLKRVMHEHAETKADVVQTDRQSVRQTDRQAGRHADRQTDNGKTEENVQI